MIFKIYLTCLKLVIIFLLINIKKRNILIFLEYTHKFWNTIKKDNLQLIINLWIEKPSFQPFSKALLLLYLRNEIKKIIK